MLQKVLVVLVGLVMSLVGAVSPSGLFATHASETSGVAVNAVDETLATVRTADGHVFARVPVLWVEVDGRRVAEDAWGTGEVKELRFKVGVKGVDAVALAVGERLVELHPTDVMTVRLFKGDFSYRGLGTTQATLQLQGAVKTTLVAQGDVNTRVRTQNGQLPFDAVAQSPAAKDSGGVAYVILDTGKRMDTVAVENGGSRFFTEDAAVAAEAKNEVGNLLAKWVKLDGKLVREYTWGDGPVGKIEFEPAEATSRSVVLAFNGAPSEVGAGTRVAVEDFVGEYVVYQVSGGLMRLRLDGYAGHYGTSSSASPLPALGPGDPVPAFTFTPANPKTTDIVQFQDASTDDGIIVFRMWDFGDNTSSVLPNPTHRFQRAGTYDVTLNVTDNDLRTSTLKRTILVRNAEPVPDFDFAPAVVTTNTLVTFTDRSFDPDGNILNWTWDFGDGERSHARHPSHRFERGGNVTVTLTVIDELQGRASLSKVVIVRNAPPFASFSYHSTDRNASGVVTQVPVQFLDNSSDRDGRIVGWNWSFGDGTYGAGSSPLHAYPRPGLYTVSLTVTDDARDVDTATTQILVQNRPPIADFVWKPQGAPAGTPYVFTSVARDLDGFVLVQSWDWGDNSSIAFGDTVSHVFARAGTYRVNLTVTDNSLATSYIVRNVSVANAAPRVEFGMTPSPAYRGDQVVFSDLSVDPDGDAIVSRVWDFGEGNVSTDAVTNRTFARTGAYPITLTVTDAAGKTSSLTRPLRVLNRAPVASVVAEPRTPYATQLVYFNATAVDPDGSGPLRYDWTFPDGSKDDRARATFAFPSQGDYVVTLVVTDDEGASSGMVTVRVRVDYAPPVAAFTFSPALPATGEAVSFFDNSTSVNGAIVSRVWDFKDGSTSRLANPTHVFSQSRVYHVSLTITDVQDRTAVIERPVLVNARPEVAFAAPIGTIPLQREVVFEDLSRDPDGYIAAWSWDFGDGGTSTLKDAPHVFTQPGTYPVKLTVTDDRGASNSTQRLVSVENQRPVARWTVATPNPIAGQPVQFISTGHAYDPDGSPILGWTWSFGDAGRAIVPDPTYVYNASGRYLASLRVSDGAAESTMDQASYGYVRVGANHPVTVSVAALLPDSRPADLPSPRFDVEVRVGAPATGVVILGKPTFTSNGTGLDIVLPAGSWMNGDLAEVRLRDTTFMASPVSKSIVLTDQHGISRSASVSFDIPLPLDPVVTPRPGDKNATFDVPVFEETNHTGDGYPVYRDMQEKFEGTGRVLFRDGSPAKGASVEVQARYVPLRVLGPVRDIVDTSGTTSLLGWCRVTSVKAGEDGSYDWRMDPANTCVTNALSFYPVGRWEVRAKASLSFATSGVSPAAPVYVDPTGGVLLALPLNLV